MISLTERTILDKRTLGRICDHGTTECKDIITLFESNRGYCSVYVCNKGLQESLCLTALNDAMGCHCERSEAIQFLGWGMRILTGLPRKSDDFLAMTDIVKLDRCRNQIQNKLWQKQSNRNISTCVAQREVA